MSLQALRTLKHRARVLADEPMARVVLRGRLEEPYRRARFHSFGRGAVVHRPGWLYGTHHIALGEKATVLRGAWLSAERETWHREEPALEIGEGVIIRPYCVFSASDSIVVEPFVGIGAYSSILDCDHGVANDWSPLNTQKVAEPIRIGRGSLLGDRVTVLRGTTIGKRCIIGAGSVVRGDIPDDSVAVGVPARVVRTNEAEAPAS